MSHLDTCIECVADSCESLGIELTDVQMKTIAEDLMRHIEMTQEIEMNRHIKAAGPASPFVPADGIEVRRIPLDRFGDYIPGAESILVGKIGETVFADHELYIKK